MSEFSNRQREKIAQALRSTEERIAELEQAAKLVGEQGVEPELGPAEDLMADVSERLDDRATARNELSEQLRAYRRALDRIDQGVYETCERCGRPVTEERLAASPTVTLCIDCQRELEREQGER